MEQRDADSWPVIVLDALEVHANLDPQARLQRNPLRFPLVETVPAKPATSQSVRKRPRQYETQLVENEDGLCSRMEQIQQSVQSRSVSHSSLHSVGSSTAWPCVPPLAAAVRAHSRGHHFKFRAISSPADERTPLAPPLLFSALIHNHRSNEIKFEALHSLWVLPRQSACALLPLSRWSELSALRPAGGYRLVLLDPPWHSASVSRKGHYSTLDKRQLLTELGPLLSRLACSDGAGSLIACWITNSRHVQSFVEGVLFPRCGARPVARWYWLKLSAAGRWTTGSEPRSSHRKPWEVLVIGHVGSGPPPPALPRRLALVSTPRGQHSAKPPLDTLLRAVADQLQPTPSAPAGQRVAAEGSATGAGSGACAWGSHSAARAPAIADANGGMDKRVDLDDDAWRHLPKIELFAREVRPFWHAVGDEVLHFQHESFFTPCDALRPAAGAAPCEQAAPCAGPRSGS